MNNKTSKMITSNLDLENLNVILKLKKEHKQSWTSILAKSKEKHYLLEWINSKTPLLQNQLYTTITKLYWILNELTDFPNCKYCENGICSIGKNVKCIRNVDSFELGYFRACCSQCPNMQKEKLKKTILTNLKKYGSINFFSSEEGKKKKEEWLKKNGITNSFQLESVKEKSRQSRKLHFGYEYTMLSEEKRKLASENYKNKTGYEHLFYNPEIKQKAKNTILEKKKSGIDISINRKIGNRKRRYEQFLKNSEVFPKFSEEDFLKLNAQTQYTVPLSWHCKKCNSDFVAAIDLNFSSREEIPVRCIKCYPILNGTSAEEKQLFDFISQYDKNAIHRCKQLINPYEVDIYCKDKSIAFEFDGLYWHSEKTNVASNYHLMKTEMCKAKDVQLIHIFEDEWLYKQDIVKSRLKNLLGIYDKTVFARKCEVKEVSSKESHDFQEANHIQGAVNSKVNLGLYFGNELISLMTFSKPRFDKKHEWELVRFCNKLGYHIPGGASKLLKHFERTYSPKNIVSYADRRWSKGKLYEALGFNFKNNSMPNYWYITNGSRNRMSRMQYQKHKLKDILKLFDVSKTEVENMHMNGFYRIFDSGNIVFEKNYI